MNVAKRQCKEINYDCELCGRPFKSESGIYLHVRVKHNMAWHRTGPYTPLVDEAQEEPACTTGAATSDSVVADGVGTTATAVAEATGDVDTALEEMLDAINGDNSGGMLGTAMTASHFTAISPPPPPPTTLQLPLGLTASASLIRST